MFLKTSNMRNRISKIVKMFYVLIFYRSLTIQLLKLNMSFYKYNYIRYFYVTQKIKKFKSTFKNSSYN